MFGLARKYFMGAIFAGANVMEPISDHILLIVLSSFYDGFIVITGVTSIKPEDMEFPSTMTDLASDTWMLR